MDIAAALRAFVRTVERGSVTAAARDLAISQPAVTKHLRNLERHVGARLLERSSRIVRPTSQGQALYTVSREALVSIDAALEGVRRDMGAVEGHLRIHAPSCVGAKHLHGIVMDFQRTYPAVTADLVLDNREIDLVYENFDLAIRYGRPADQNLIIRRLGAIRRILVAAPSFLARFGPIDTLARLSEVALITSESLLSKQDVLALRDRDNAATELPVRAALRTNNAEVIVATLVAGHAAGPVQHLLVDSELADGRLVRILPEYEVRPTEAFLAYPSVRFMRPVVRAFTDFAVPALRNVPGIMSGRDTAPPDARAMDAPDTMPEDLPARFPAPVDGRADRA
ncbi:LysR family transcriptional regulator [Aquabacter spiritensis]|uniref:LysR family transcriptional regulator n=1 Tax=Aquabacter spiritensis TaxID=933073 RepID=A0A4R3LJW8_9HYPH|nr:LysR family transcriptional regulator [Aquabacter spiritensis]TCT00513.1 LysR family transcriptional regulator [Aquabacter spiritensis]